MFVMRAIAGARLVCDSCVSGSICHERPTEWHRWPLCRSAVRGVLGDSLCASAHLAAQQWWGSHRIVVRGFVLRDIVRVAFRVPFRASISSRLHVWFCLCLSSLPSSGLPAFWGKGWSALEIPRGGRAGRVGVVTCAPHAPSSHGLVADCSCSRGPHLCQPSARSVRRRVRIKLWGYVPCASCPDARGVRPQRPAEGKLGACLIRLSAPRCGVCSDDHCAGAPISPIGLNRLLSAPWCLSHPLDL